MTLRKCALLCALVLLAGCGSGGGTANNDPVVRDDGLWRGTWIYKEGTTQKDSGTAEVILTPNEVGNLDADIQLTSTATGGVTLITIPALAERWTVTLPGKAPATYTGAGFDFHTSMGVSYGPGEPRTLHISVPIIDSARKYTITATRP